MHKSAGRGRGAGVQRHVGLFGLFRSISLDLKSKLLLGFCAAVVQCVVAPMLMSFLGSSSDLLPFSEAYVLIRAYFVFASVFAHVFCHEL